MNKSLVAGLVAVAAAGPAYAESVSPIFGHATVQVTTASENKGIVGKGTYGELYAYYGSLYASYAVQYASIGQYYGYSSTTGGSSYFYDAYLYASYATSYYYNAYYYQSRGE